MTSDTQYDGELHLLASQGNWDALTQSILLQLKSQEEDGPSALHEKLLTREGPNKWTPLMLSCARAPSGVIALLLECCPESCTIVDRSQSSPLHLICSCTRGDNKSDSDFRKVILMLLQESPESLSSSNQWGQTPLHCIFDNKTVPCIDTLRVLLGMWVSQGEVDNDNLYENIASESMQERKVAEEIGAKVQFHARAALASLDSKSYLPLHYASSKGAPEKALRLLSALYSDAATISTTTGDLPCHLLHRWGDSLAGPNESIYQIVSRGQVESLLEPLCVSLPKPSSKGANAEAQNCEERDGTMVTISERDEETDFETSTGAASSALLTGTSTNPASNSAIAAIACRSPGANGVKLPLHIAAEHDVSYGILSCLCEQFPSGVAIPSSISAPYHSNGSVDGESKSSKDFIEVYSIELFEHGRAAEEMKELEQVDDDGNTISQSSSSSTHEANIQSYHQRFYEKSDLLFAYFPNAKSNQCRIEASGESVVSQSTLSQASKAKKDKISTYYCKQKDRLRRIQQLIQKEACDSTSTSLSTVAKLLWTWLLDSIQPSSIVSETGLYLYYFGCIITDLEKASLLKLSYNAQTTRSTDDSNAIGAPFTINGKTIEQEAEDRKASVSFQELLECEMHLNWHYTVVSFLNSVDGSNYSMTCRHTRNAGIRYLAEGTLEESGRTWNLSSHNELENPSKSELWQYLDQSIMCQHSTHTIHVSFYLELSELKSQAGGSSSSTNSMTESMLDARSGGLIVMSEKKASRPCGSDASFEQTVSERTSVYDGTIETTDQRKLKYSRISTQSGCEVTLSFRYNPNRSYSLWVVGPPLGGRVSISNARIRQLVHVLDRKKRNPLHVLLMNRHYTGLSPPLRTQVSILMKTNLGAEHSILHYALKCGVSVEVMKELININPSSLLDIDENGRTALHAAFLSSRDEAPSLAVIETLLSGVGENATKLKDQNGNLVLHLAAERGSDKSILGLLVDCHPDGCYRTNNQGDLPLHLLARSRFANTSSIEILLSPIIHNETICRIAGSGDEGLPLHVACSYTCSFQVLEALLLTYGEAALIPKKLDGKIVYPLDLFEQHRTDLESRQSRTHGKDVAHFEMAMADFNLRSDLIFAHNPLLTPTIETETDMLPLYRQEVNRIERLQKVIRREAIECSADGNEMSQLARYSWCFFCNFQSPDDPDDHYTKVVDSILRGMPTSAVKVLAEVTNPFSIPNEPITDCATLMCKELILRRIQFLGRYLFDDDESMIHKSDSCLVLSAIDYGAVESYKHIISLFLIPETPDIDDLRTIDSDIGTCVLSGDDINSDNIKIIRSLFQEFAVNLGYNAQVAKSEFERIFISILEDAEGEVVNIGEHKARRKSFKKERMMESFNAFCKAQGVQDGGTRNVVMKFMTNRSRFLWEKVTRSELDMGVDWQVFPILEDYDIDRIDSFSENSSTECKDSLYATQIQEKNSIYYDLSLYKYCLVLPKGGKNLEDIFRHEDLNIIQRRDYLQQVGDALSMMHKRNIIHGSVKMSNIVRFSPSRLALVDLSCACPVKDNAMNNLPDLDGDTVQHSRRYFTSLMPPEMISKIDCHQQRHLLRMYEAEWKQVADDALDLSLFTPDDVFKITTAVGTMLAKTKNDIGNKLTEKADFLRSSINTTSLLDDADDDGKWKDQITGILGDISFEDLPDSLSCCSSLMQFSSAWDRLNTSAKAWEMRRPRFSSDGKHAYIFNKSTDGSTLREQQLHNFTASENMDIWSFGLLVFSLCGRGVSLFPSDKDDQLVDDDSYERLYNWDHNSAKRLVSSHIDDPLVQDLLLKILVPEHERMTSIDTILRHPFFQSTQGDEARRIYETFEEARMMEVNDLSDESNNTTLFSMERLCKIVFDRTENLTTPTCFIVLPYKLTWNETENRFMAPMDFNTLSLGQSVGKCLMEINALTAKLSFWLRIKETLSQKSAKAKEFKDQIRSWLDRARTESSNDIAKELVRSIGYGEEYIGVCMEMLDKNIEKSKAQDFIRDPMKAAMNLMKRAFNSLAECFQRHMYFYLVDEYSGLPHVSRYDNSTQESSIYPIQIRTESRGILEGTFLPFVNLTVMSILSQHGTLGVAKLMGLPTSLGIPDEWRDAQIGFSHAQKSDMGRSSILEFGTLQNILRRQEKSQARSTSESLDDESDMVGIEIQRLESFFGECDPNRTFDGLRRMCDKQDDSITMWTLCQDLTSSPIDSTTTQTCDHHRPELKEQMEEKRRLEVKVETLCLRMHSLRKKSLRRARMMKSSVQTKHTQSKYQDQSSHTGS